MLVPCVLIGRVVRRSGDGVVPYSSMRYPQCWDGDDFEARSVELEGQEHRDVLGSEALRTVLAQVSPKLRSHCGRLL